MRPVSFFPESHSVTLDEISIIVEQLVEWHAKQHSFTGNFLKA